MVILVDPMITFPELMADYYFDDLLTVLTNLSYLIIFSMSLIFRERERERERRPPLTTFEFRMLKIISECCQR